LLPSLLSSLLSLPRPAAEQPMHHQQAPASGSGTTEEAVMAGKTEFDGLHNLSHNHKQERIWKTQFGISGTWLCASRQDVRIETQGIQCV
jgi:hypothetical protein